MELKNLKDLEKAVKLCRRLGVDALEVGNVKFNLGLAPRVKSKSNSADFDIPEANLKVPQFTPTIENDLIKTDDLSEDELLFYSAVNESQGV